MLWLALAGVVSVSSAQAPAKVNVTGTTWQWAPSNGATGMTVTFRKDGVVLFVSPRPEGEKKFTGHWEQSGNNVTFDANGYTEYRVVVNGAEMSGEWERLQGPQKGDTNPTSLKKI